MTPLVYFSTKSENTHRFVAKIGCPAMRIPARADTPSVRAESPYILVVPTYAGANGRGAVPAPVIRFLNDPMNRALLRGVVAGGNSNFGATFGLAGSVIARKCGVPYRHRFELMGFDADVKAVQQGVNGSWIQ